MKEQYYEESAVSQKSVSQSKIYTVLNVISLIFFGIAILQVFFSFSFVSVQLTARDKGDIGQLAFILSIVEWVLIFLFAVGMFIFFFFFKRRFNISYDYIYVEDELRVSEVFNGKKRKLVRRFEIDHILKIGWVSKPSFERTTAGLHRKSVILLSPNKQPSEGKDFYYFLYSDSLEKKVYIIEARQEMLEYLVRAAGMNKLERN